MPIAGPRYADQWKPAEVSYLPSAADVEALYELTRAELLERARAMPSVADRVTTRLRKAELVELCREGLAQGDVVQVPPDGLGEAGLELWDRIAGEYVLEPRERTVLEHACRQADDIARLDAAITESGAIVAGSKGQPRLAQAITEARQARLALARLLDQIDLPEGDDDEEGGTGAARRARKAAETRWERERERRERHLGAT